MALGKIKIKIKTPTPTAAERFHAQQQKNRKAAGLPDPSEYKKKLDAMKTEEVEQLDEMPESNMKVRDVHSHLKKAGWALARSSGGHDVFKHPKAKHSIPVPRHALKPLLVRGIMKASKVEEQLEKKGRFVSGPVKQPFKSNTIVTPVKEATDEREYDYEGDMAKSDLRSIIHNAQTLHDMLDDDTNLAEWCQSKITLAEDYISTVTNYMRSEMKEEVELDEAKKMEYDQKKVNHLKYIVDILEKEKKEFSRLKDSKEVMDAINKAINIFAKEYTKHLNALSAGRGQDTNFRVIEEVEQIDEISAQLKASYVAGAKKQIKQSIPYTKKGQEYRDIAKNFIAKRERGIAKVTESADDDPKADQMTTDDTKFPKKSRKAQIVKSAAKKLPPEDQFQAKPVLDSQVAQQTNK